MAAEDRVWEPWQPEIGHRVRVRLSAECDARFVARYVCSGQPATDPGRHFPEVDGVVGVISEAVPPGEEEIPGHRFYVRFDRKVRILGLGDLIGVCVAAIELEPVE